MTLAVLLIIGASYAAPAPNEGCEGSCPANHAPADDDGSAEVDDAFAMLQAYQKTKLQVYQKTELHVKQPRGRKGTTDQIPPVQTYPYDSWTISSLDMYPPMLIGATWGVNNCQGLNDTSSENAQRWGCVDVRNDTNGDCVGDGAYINRVSPPNQMNVMLLTGSSQLSPRSQPQYPLSAVAVKFSWQIDQSTLEWSDFEFGMSDGTTRQPYGLNVIPDSDADEVFTVTLYGSIGNGTWGYNGDWTTGSTVGAYPVSITVVDELVVTNGTHSYDMQGAYFEGGNLDYTKGGVLTTAYVRAWEPAQAQGPTSSSPVSYGNNNCSTFNKTNYVLTAQTMGGTSYDGVNGFSPLHTELYEIIMKDESKLRRDAFLGLEDIDGDDFTDICLQITEEEYQEMDKLVMVCNPENPCQYSGVTFENN